MKIAGRKNDSAWYRANKFIQTLNSDQREALADQMSAGSYSDGAYNEISAFAAELHVDITATAPNVNAWCLSMATHGIPRQVWYGKYSYVTYSQNGDFKYVPNYGTALFAFSKELRKLMVRATFGFREINDLTNAAEHNPGKLPNAEVES